MKVLIAEDDAVSRFILQTAVQTSGHQVLTAEDGEQGWRLFQETADVDVVISDWMMPTMDGLELCRRVRSKDQEGYTYFVLVTALEDRDHVLQGIEGGADEYLTKPLDRSQLQARLKSAARLHSVHRRLTSANSELAQTNKQLHAQSRTDALTGLGNRLRMEEDLHTLSELARRYGHRYCAVLCDVDEFKAYNDHYGHQAGDEALRRVGQTIIEHCRAGDSAYRYGGEELLVILPEQTLSGGVAFAERLRSSVESLRIPHEAAEASSVLTLSIGVAELAPRHVPNVETLLSQADAALYAAKEAGRNKAVAHRQKVERQA